MGPQLTLILLLLLSPKQRKGPDHGSWRALFKLLHFCTKRPENGQKNLRFFVHTDLHQYERIKTEVFEITRPIIQ